MKPLAIAMKKVMDRSDIMDLAKIQYFLEAARLNNFTEAARKCHIAQTTMTKYISQLEKETGLPSLLPGTPRRLADGRRAALL